MGDGTLALRVLVSDKDSEFRQLLADYLGSKGCRVCQACSGTATWALLQQRSYNFVVLDLEMQDINGMELLRLIRRLDPGPIVLLVGSWKSPATERIALALGAEEFFVKPFRLSEVYDFLTEHAHPMGSLSSGLRR